MAALVEFDVAQARINCTIHPDKIHRQLSSSRLANGRLHAYHSVITMSLLHPALLILYRSRPTLKTTVVMLGYAEEGEMYLLAIIHQRLIISGDVELNPGPLGVLDLRSVTNELVSVIAKWYSIGVQLGVSEHKLEEIETNYQKADRRFSEVIKFWLRGNTRVAMSWESLVEVLESPSVDEKGLARRLREKGGMVVSETVGVPGATESGVQPQEINRGQRGKKRSAEEKLNNSGEQPREQHRERQVFEEREHIEATLEAIERGALSHTVVHGVFVGPARSGKNSLMEKSQKQSAVMIKESCFSQDQIDLMFTHLAQYAARWRAIGTGLQFTQYELDNIENMPSLFFTAPGSMLRKMLSDWLQWAPGDNRGSTSFATVDALITALVKAGLAAAADDLNKALSST